MSRVCNCLRMEEEDERCRDLRLLINFIKDTIDFSSKYEGEGRMYGGKRKTSRLQLIKPNILGYVL